MAVDQVTGTAGLEDEAMKTMWKLLTPLGLGTLWATVDWTVAFDPLLKLISEVGVLGVLIWYLWYITSKDRPRIEERHAAEAKSLAEAHASAVRFMVDDFRAEAKEQRAATKANVDHICAQMETQNNTVMEIVRNCAATRSRGEC